MTYAIVRTGKRGRPPTGAKSIHLTLAPDLLAKLDDHIARIEKKASLHGMDTKLSRPEAIRELLEGALR